MRRRWIVSSLAGVLSLAIVASLALWSFHEQINITIRARGCAKALQNERELNGEFPAEFSCHDHRGRTIFYQRSGSGFVLNSQKDDGNRSLGDVCLEPWRPIVFTERGALAHCSL